MKGRIIRGIVLVVLLLLVIGGIVAAILSNRFEYNDDDAVGNTAGNLYNGGLFCESEEYIYFSNPNKSNQLYRMDKDGDNIEKVHSDKASYINSCGDYIYYVRNNHEDGGQAVFRGNLYGIYRMKIGDDMATELYGEIANSLTLSGNKLYFQSYSDEDLIRNRSVNIDGKELTAVSEDDYVPVSVCDGYVYYSNVDGNHNIVQMDAEDNSKTTIKQGNYYMPIVEDGVLYYIDIEAGYKLTKEDLSTGRQTVLTDDRCINYNVHTKYGVIYYQCENDENDHRLMMMDLDGDNLKLVDEGACSKIHITKKHTYYCKLVGADSIWYYVETGEEPEPKEFR